MKKTISVAAALCALCINLSAQSMAFLNVNPDASVAAMAGAGVARVANAYAYASNIASIALSDSRMAVAAGYGMWQPKAANNGIISAAGYYRIGDKLGISANFSNFSSKEYTITNDTGRISGTFTPKEMTFGLGAAYKIADCFSAGVNLKMATSALATDAKASSFAADIALMYVNGALKAGLSANNIGGKVSYGGDSYSLPMLIKGGASYCFSGVTASTEVGTLNSGLMAALGLEYSFKDIVFVRAGYHYGDKEKTIPSYASVGLGAKYSGVELNFAYLLASETVGGSMMFTLGYSF